MGSRWVAGTQQTTLKVKRSTLHKAGHLEGEATHNCKSQGEVGEHGEEVARTINEFRGEHPELAHACIVKDVMVDWATMLLDAGFDEHPEAVVNVLCGGEPPLVARIRRMKVDNEGLPPGVSMIIDPIQLEAERKAKQEEE